MNLVENTTIATSTKEVEQTGWNSIGQATRYIVAQYKNLTLEITPYKVLVNGHKYSSDLIPTTYEATEFLNDLILDTL